SDGRGGGGAGAALCAERGRSARRTRPGQRIVGAMSALEELLPLIEIAAAEAARLWAALRDGTVVAMDRLAQSIEELHGLAAGLDPDEAAPVRPRMLGLLAEVDLLQAEMTAAHAVLEAELRSTTARHRAANAYGRP